MPRARGKSIIAGPASPAAAPAGIPSRSRALAFLAAEDLLDPVAALELQRLVAATEQRPVTGVVAGRGIHLDGAVLVQLRRYVDSVVGAGEVPYGNCPEGCLAFGPHPALGALDRQIVGDP